MFISALELFKIGVGPSSSHTMGPMLAARQFRGAVEGAISDAVPGWRVCCTLRGSLAHTGRGHATDRAVLLGLHGYLPESAAEGPVEVLLERLQKEHTLSFPAGDVGFCPAGDIVFDTGPALPQHPNGMIFQLFDDRGHCVLSRTLFSIGGGFVADAEHIGEVSAPLPARPLSARPFPFDSAASMLQMAQQSGLSVSQMKRANECEEYPGQALDQGLDRIWAAMRRCVQNGLATEGELPGGLGVFRRARQLQQRIQVQAGPDMLNDWLCMYAMAVNEENAAGHMVVTAPTNGAAGIIPAVMHYCDRFMTPRSPDWHRAFLLTAGAIGMLFKENASISGADVGCQGEVGVACSMAAGALAEFMGGSPRQIENAAEIGMEHNLGLTCDPIGGLVQVPCIERNAMGAIKAINAARIALSGDGKHVVSLDKVIKTMRDTGADMQTKYKETSRGGLAVNVIEC